MNEIESLRYIHDNHMRLRPEINSTSLLMQWLLGSILIAIVSFALFMIFYDLIRPRYMWEIKEMNNSFLIVQILMASYPAVLMSWCFSILRNKVFRIGGIIKIISVFENISRSNYSDDSEYYKHILIARKKYKAINSNLIVTASMMKLRINLISIGLLITKIAYVAGICLAMYILAINWHRAISSEYLTTYSNMLKVMGSIPVFSFILMGITGYIQNEIQYTYTQYPDWNWFKKHYGDPYGNQ